ncbi:hypothetical protein C0J52_18034 [Blattella germanica]|nr:hypothetical protein C0J52_18034 [Blattella germanica]
MIRNKLVLEKNCIITKDIGTIKAQKELQELCLRIEDEKSHCNISSGWNLKQYLKPHVLKPFFIVYIFNILQIPCGTNLFIFYSVDIISNATTDETMNVNFINILTSSTRVIFMAASCLCLVWIGRRTISITSGVGSGIACVILGTAVYLQYDQAWLISTLVVLYVAFNTYGFFVLPPSMIGEILPSKIRCPVGAYIFVSNDIGMFVATKIFLSVNRSVGAHGLFWIFGSSSLFCALFLYLLLPETKGQSLVQLEQYFLQSNVLWITRHRTKTSVLTNSSNKRNMINK